MLRQALALLLFASTAFAVPKVDCAHPNGQLYKDHWEACSLSAFQAKDRYLNSEASLWADRCDKNIYFENGTLWKPVSEGRNAPFPVLLLPGAYLGANVEVYHPSGYEVAVGNDYGELLNGGRAHFGITRLARDLPFDLRIVIDRGQGTECLYMFDPKQRQE